MIVSVKVIDARASEKQWLTLLLVLGLVGSVGRVRANHLLHLVRDTHALDNLNVLHA